MKKKTSRLLNFFPHNMRREIRELYVSTTILDFGVAMVLIFEPIYLYTIGYSLLHIVSFFLLVYLLYFLIVPLGASFAKHVGYEHSIAYSSVVCILYYLVFFHIASAPSFFYISALLYAITKALYWPAYHADFARFQDTGQDAREISTLTILVAVVSVAAPLISGVVLENWGFAALFTFVSIIFLVSNIPLLVTKEIFEPGRFSYFDAYKLLFSSVKRKSFIAYLGFGEELVVLVVWPVFIVTVVKDLLDVGILTALATLVSVIVTLYIGRSSDTGNKRGILRFGTIVYSFAWFLRLIVKAAPGIFMTDSLSRISKNIVSVPLTAITYENAQKQSVMHSVVFYEMSLVVGKLLALIIIFAALLFLSSMFTPMMLYQGIFVFAGLTTLLYMTL